MPEEINNSEPNKAVSNQGFVTKSVENTSTGSFVREQLQGGGFFGFYKANKIYFWAIFVGVVLISVLAYFAFKPSAPAPVLEANVNISVEVPQNVPSGGEAVYKITVQNNDPQKLVDLELELAYPSGVVYQSSSPNASNLSHSLFEMPDLISGQNAVVFVKTKASGNLNEKKTLEIKLHYKYANFNSEFVKQAQSEITLVASNVIIELEGPASTNNAQLVQYLIKYQNNSDTAIKSARVKMIYPEGFVFASANPSPSLGSDTWDIGALAEAASGSIQIQGTFSSSIPGQNKTATAEFLILGDGGQFFVQNSSSFITEISNLPLLVEQRLNPENLSGVASPGDTLNFSVRYQNNSSVLAHGVNISVTLDSKAVDLSSIRSEGGQINNNTISWNASTVSQLETLAPNESGQLSFNFKISDPATKDSSKNLTLVSNIKIKSSEYESFFPGNSLSFKISSPSSINATLSFFSGQLPPKLGLSTTYKVRLALNNSSNDLGNGQLTAYIPLGFGSFVSSSVSSGEKIDFDASTGKLTWNFGNLPAFSGKFTTAKAVEFQLVFNPNQTQVGTSPVLLKDIKFTARDSFTLQEVSASAKDLNTGSLPGNDGFNKGTVQE